jgi:hypothetical protein
MSKMQLTQKTETENVETSTALAKPLPQFTGDWDYNDTRIPRLNLVHKTSDGEMIERFGIGAFCFNKEIKLSDGKTPLLVTALRAGKDFIQKLPFGDPEMPLVFKSKDEVLANGGSFNKKDAANRTYYIPRAHIQFIVRMPEDTDEEGSAMFPYEHDGHQYGMAILTVSSSAYTATAVELATLCAHNSVMRKGMPYGKLELTSSPRVSPRYSWLVPQIQFAGANKEDFIKFVEGLM